MSCARRKLFRSYLFCQKDILLAPVVKGGQTRRSRIHATFWYQMYGVKFWSFGLIHSTTSTPFLKVDHGMRPFPITAILRMAIIGKCGVLVKSVSKVLGKIPKPGAPTLQEDLSQDLWDRLYSAWKWGVSALSITFASSWERPRLCSLHSSRYVPFAYLLSTTCFYCKCIYTHRSLETLRWLVIIIHY